MTLQNHTHPLLQVSCLRVWFAKERSFTGFATTGDTFIIQNPDLSSERSLNFETGLKVRYDRYFGGLTVYYNDLTDFISTEFLGEDPDSGFQIIGHP